MSKAAVLAVDGGATSSMTKTCHVHHLSPAQIDECESHVALNSVPFPYSPHHALIDECMPFAEHGQSPDRRQSPKQ